ncbi:MAG: hypothetical protein A2798_00920 [Candidatus Levybacteria bacterium RIFCSPHIGHO2_01_FULL_37_17]|nr:MAG: hypothetical protein A2798_00920 [Candidatus Levybacteria bacterium RIFCSPHIGHO2_01_FULL_37_17]OGH37013.1 MAG: hypothetical protein A2959_01780 [Candidatus Levybacteria bacterium RIFCSPLOWO2_01_FULL_38_23]
MKEFIKSVRRDGITFNIFLSSLLVGVFTIILILINYVNLPPYVPIFNQMPWGDSRLSETPGIFIPSALFMIVFILNFSFASFLYVKNNPLLARIVASITLTIAVMNLLLIVKLLLLI